MVGRREGEGLRICLHSEIDLGFLAIWDFGRGVGRKINVVALLIILST